MSRNAALSNAAATAELFPAAGIFPLVIQSDFEEQEMHLPLPPGTYWLFMGLDHEGKPFSWGNAKGRRQTEHSRDRLPHLRVDLGVRTNRSLLGTTDFIFFFASFAKHGSSSGLERMERWETDIGATALGTDLPVILACQLLTS